MHKRTLAPSGRNAPDANPSAPTGGGIIADRPQPSGVTIENLAPGEGGILPDRPQSEGVVIQDLSPIHRLILEAMQRAEIVIENATSEHQRAFALQMREKLGVADLVMKEPQLPILKVQAMLDYLVRLENLVEKFPANSTDTATQEALSSALEKRKLEITLHYKQRLDESRQREAGVGHYIWHTVGDDRVRASHEANEGQTFSWDDPPPTGHPGEAENCRCSAEPVVINDPPIEPVYPELIFPVFRLARIAKFAYDLVSKRLGEDVARNIEQPKPQPTTPPKPAEPAPSKPENGAACHRRI